MIIFTRIESKTCCMSPPKPADKPEKKGSMDLIDEDGKLFGRINIIDALVILFVAAVIVTGAAFTATTIGADESSPETHETFATIDIGTQPLHLANQISEGDKIAKSGDILTITDVYVGPAGGDKASVVIRGATGSNSQSNGSSIKYLNYAGSSYSQGGGISLRTNEYFVKGRILSIGTEQSSLDTETTQVQLQTSMSEVEASALEPGETYDLGSRTVGTIEEVTTVPSRTDRNVTLGVSLQTINKSGETLFGSYDASIGSSIPFELSTTNISATVVHRGGLAPGSPTKSNVEVHVRNVSPGVANAIETGTSIGDGANSTVTVLEKQVTPATVILTSDSGDIHRQDHPVNKDVVLTLELQARQTERGVWFRGQPLKVGTNLRLDFDTVAVNGSVENLNVTDSTDS